MTCKACKKCDESMHESEKWRKFGAAKHGCWIILYHDLLPGPYLLLCIVSRVDKPYKRYLFRWKRRWHRRRRLCLCQTSRHGCLTVCINSDISRESFNRLLEVHLFSTYSSSQSISGPTVIDEPYKSTFYLLTYLQTRVNICVNKEDFSAWTEIGILFCDSTDQKSKSTITN